MAKKAPRLSPQPSDLNPNIVYPYDPRLRPLPVPSKGVFEDGEVLLCLNPEWVSHLSGLFLRLNFSDAWLGTEEQIEFALQQVELLMSKLTEGNMSCGCDDNRIVEQFYDSEGHLNVRYEDGTTERRDDLDPRFNSPIFPPLSGADGDDKKCAAAASIVETMKEDFIGKMETGQSMTDLIAVVFAAIVLFVTSVGTLTPLIFAMITAVMAFSISATKAAFTPEVWEQFKCILYCHMNANASFSETQWQAIKQEISAAFGSSIVSTVLGTTVNTAGTAGLTNMARSGRVVDADCSSCNCDDCPPVDVFIGVLVDMPDACTFIVDSDDSQSPGFHTVSLEAVGFNGVSGGEGWQAIEIEFLEGSAAHPVYGYACDDNFYDPLNVGQCVKRLYWQGSEGEGAFRIRVRVSQPI